MKYAIVGPRGAINRISDTEPQVFGEQTVIELTDEQATPVEAGLAEHPKLHFFWNGTDVLTKAEWLEWKKWDAMTLEEAKAAKIRELESARYQAEVAGIELPDGKFIRTDKETQAELGKALSLISTVDPSLEIDWKFPDGEVVHMDPTQIQEITGAVFTHVQATRTTYKDKAALVEAATAKDELDAITW